ncbi:hypothetical protein [Devosia sp. 2618]|uniref:hypothetical protein n=1 Tax=Devosia sp. 2618 TaxID=3156454 RepID=UPI00339AD039
MKVRSFLSAAAIVSALAVPGLVYAQDSHMIGGKAVPTDQVEAVQAKCDALRKAESDAAAATTPAPAAGAATTPTPSATPGWTADGGMIDVESLTVALCDEGQFAAPAM